MSSPVIVDSAGRVLLPSAVRRQLNLRAGTRLTLDVVAERIELTPLSSPQPALAASATGRKVLASAGKPFDAAAATRAERQSQARRASRR